MKWAGRQQGASAAGAGTGPWPTRSQTLAEIRHGLVDVERSTTATLANSVWSFSQEALRIELDSMLQTRISSR